MAHILLIGGHGKVAQLLTPVLLARSWTVTSMIRTAEQKGTIEALARDQPGKLNVLVSNVENVKSEGDAQKILDKVKPDWVVWSAGAGGRGGPERTKAIDQDAAIFFTKASTHTPSIKKFLTVSYNASRHHRPSWWSDKDWESAQKVNRDILPKYYTAKLAADEVLTTLAQERLDGEIKKGIPENERFHGISLRPGMLTDDPAGGVSMGKIQFEGQVSRATVAEAVASVLETEGARGWIDMLDGQEKVDEAVKRIVKDGIDCVDGEDLDAMKARAAKL